MKDEAVESVFGLIVASKREAKDELDVNKKREILRSVEEMEESLPSLQAIQGVGGEREESMHDDFMTASPDDMLADISTYLTYYANDIAIISSLLQDVACVFR